MADDEVLTLTAGGWFSVMGNRVAPISSDQLPDGPSDGSDLVGKRVIIDGDPYRVVAVESCRVNHSDKTKRCSRGYGLMVVPHTPYADATPEDIAEAEKKYGQTMDELVKEAEAGYDITTQSVDELVTWLQTAQLRWGHDVRYRLDGTGLTIYQDGIYRAAVSLMGTPFLVDFADDDA